MNKETYDQYCMRLVKEGIVPRSYLEWKTGKTLAEMSGDYSKV